MGKDSAPDAECPRGIWGSIRGGVNLRGHCWATPSRVRVATHPSCFGSPVRVLGDSCDGDGEVDESSCDTAQEVLGRGGRGHCPGLPGVEHSFGIWSRAGSPDRGMGSEGHQVAGTGLEPTVPRGQWALQAALTHLVPCRSGTPGAPALSWPHLALPSSPPPLPFLPLPRCPWRLPAAGLPRSGSSWPSPAQWTTGRGPACSLPCGWAHKHISLFDEKDVGNLVTCFLLALQWGETWPWASLCHILVADTFTYHGFCSPVPKMGTQGAAHQETHWI